MAKWPKRIIRLTLPSRFSRGVVCGPQAIGQTSGVLASGGEKRTERGLNLKREVEKGELITERGLYRRENKEREEDKE
jgi:hypothetical protein